MPELEAFPIIGKQDIVADYEGFIAGGLGVDRAELAALLQDGERRRASISEGARWRNIVIEETSGTSGVPFNFPKFIAERAMAACEIWKWRRRIDPQASNGSFYPFLHAPIGFKHVHPPSEVSPENIAKLYAHLSAKGVRWVHGPPELLRQHAEILRGLGQFELTVKFFETSGLYLSEAAKSDIEAVGIKVVNQYGCRETWVIGYGAGSTSDFEILRDNVWVEIVDDAGQPVIAAEVAGDIVVTTRYQRLMPFVRYRTGDRGSWLPGKIGSGLALMNTEREPGAWRWGKWGSGSRFFRIMLARAYMETGYIPMQYLQVREEGYGAFTVVTNDIPRREELGRVLAHVCAASAPRRADDSFRFSTKVLWGDELAGGLGQKTQLFKPMPKLDPAKTQSYY